MAQRRQGCNEEKGAADATHSTEALEDGDALSAYGGGRGLTGEGEIEGGDVKRGKNSCEASRRASGVRRIAPPSSHLRCLPEAHLVAEDAVGPVGVVVDHPAYRHLGAHGCRV